jgi:ABC-type transporter Mla maintaining outer membrane lipid asymmetry ATPase subunit MlaF
MIELHDLTLDALDGRPLLAGLEVTVPAGGNLLVMGPSGSGKSRLLKVMAGVEAPARGRVRVGGVDLWPGRGALGWTRRPRLGLAFASGGLISNLSLRDNVALPLRFLDLPAEEIRQRVDDALASMGLSAVQGLRPHAISASARKHANLARVMALDPEVILLDDPLEGLDSVDRGRVAGLIRTWAHEAHRTLVLAQEEPGVVAALPWIHLDLHPLSLPLEMP